MSRVTPEQLDDILPQTQCGLCGYGGCMPYAEAMVFEQAPINLCPPGGVSTLYALGHLLQQDPAPYLAEMEAKAKPPMTASIREAECIGCTKCIQACPVDAILGSAKQMHSIIGTECTGCGLCVPPCPVDCIDLSQLSSESPSSSRHYYRERYHAREARLAAEKKEAQLTKSNHSALQKQHYILDAIARAKSKKSNG